MAKKEKGFLSDAWEATKKASSKAWKDAKPARDEAKKLAKKAHKKAPVGSGTAATIAFAWMCGLPGVVEGAIFLGGVGRDAVKWGQDKEKTEKKKKDTPSASK